MLIEDHLNIIINHTVNHTCPCYRMLIEDHMNIIVNNACPCYCMLIDDHMNIIVKDTSPFLLHTDRRSFEHYS